MTHTLDMAEEGHRVAAVCLDCQWTSPWTSRGWGIYRAWRDHLRTTSETPKKETTK